MVSELNQLQEIYIRNQILNMPMKISQELVNNNREFNKRSDYENIIGYVDKFIGGETINRFLVLAGLRDIGKTTLLFQVYEYLLKEKNVNPRDILYFSCDRLKKMGKVDIYETVNHYVEYYHGSLLETLARPVFILVDEAQYDGEWSLSGKIIFDASKNIFMIFSGSSALNLSYSADAARRLVNIPIYPLTYAEHLKLKYGNFDNDVSEEVISLVFDGRADDDVELDKRVMDIQLKLAGYDSGEWNKFLEFGGLPSSFYQDTKDITRKMVDMVDKVVKTDMTNIEGINRDTQYLAFQILNYFAFQNPGTVSKGSLSNTFDAKVGLVSKVISILEKTQLIFHVEAFTSSATRTTKPREYFFASPSLKHNLALDVGNAILEDRRAYLGKLLENYVASRFYNLDDGGGTSYKIYYDDSSKNSEKNVDFIVQRGVENPIPVEVSCGRKNKSQIKRAIGRYHSSHGIIISDTTVGVVREDNIIYLPHMVFAFM